MRDPLPDIDLVDCPFTDADSRLLVRRSPDGVSIASAEYERPVEQCRLLSQLIVRGPDGAARAVRAANAAAVEWDGGVSLVFADPSTLSLGLPPGEWQVELWVVAPPQIGAADGHAGTDLDDRTVRWQADAEHVEQHAATSGDRSIVRIEIATPTGRRDAQVVMSTQGTGNSVSPDVAPHGELAAQARQCWTDWFGQMPRLRPDLDRMGRLAWWALRANRLRVDHDPSRSMVVPSKLGYVGAWQWDSYFIAAGLRHGAPDLAWEQIAMFLDHQLDDGLLPDVVSDDGVLASTTDLPPGDAAASMSLVPVTKPPLIAWALAQLNRVAPDPARLAWARPRITASQRWWTTVSDTDGDGLAEYLHPYSSGLDDSPLFDAGMPAEPPDLNSYLCLQDDLLSAIAATEGDAYAANAHRAEAHERMSRMLETRFDLRARRFDAMAGGQPLSVFTPFHLMPLLTGRLPGPVAAAVVETMLERLWGRRPLPTVAPDEPSFDPQRMWRGPVWVNVNRLVAEGLLASGRHDLARELAERTLAMMLETGGFHEYWNPLTGERPPTATTSFAWSAALFIDLAVAVTDDINLLRPPIE